jgi:plastocyanin
MASKAGVFFVIILLLIAGGAIYFFTQQHQPIINNNQQLNNSNDTNIPDTILPVSETHNVAIQNMAFNPQTLVIKAGESVVWTNMDTITHSVKSDSGTEINSPYMDQKQSYLHTFNTAGNFSYHCVIHSTTMKGMIIVE